MRHNRQGGAPQGGASSSGPSSGPASSSSWYSANQKGDSAISPLLEEGGELNNANSAYTDDDVENEAPLLEELGINFEHMMQKNLAVLYPNRTLESKVVEDSDMAGPLVYCLSLGFLMLFQGKVLYGYIYAFSIFSCLIMYGILNLMCGGIMDVWFICSCLGYGLVPVIVLAVASIGVNATSIITGTDMKGLFGFMLSVVAVAWSTFSVTRLIDAKLKLSENTQFWLVAYPVGLVYSCFTLITVL